MIITNTSPETTNPDCMNDLNSKTNENNQSEHQKENCYIDLREVVYEKLDGGYHNYCSGREFKLLPKEAFCVVYQKFVNPSLFKFDKDKEKYKKAKIDFEKNYKDFFGILLSNKLLFDENDALECTVRTFCHFALVEIHPVTEKQIDSLYILGQILFSARAHQRDVIVDMLIGEGMKINGDLYNVVSDESSGVSSKDIAITRKEHGEYIYELYSDVAEEAYL